MAFVPWDTFDSAAADRPAGPPARPLLPDGYYLEHFRGFIENIRQTYFEFLNDSERELVLGFPELTHCEQQLFVRLANRVGTVFMRSSLRYPEIAIDTAVQGLRTKGLLCGPDEALRETCLRALHKRHLVALLANSSPQDARSFRSWPKEQLCDEALRVVTFEALSSSALCADLIIRKYVEELRYLCFLAFGDLRSDLKLYALRDLGIRRSNERGQEFTCRFSTPEEGRSEFTYRLLRDDVREADPEALPSLREQPARWPSPIGTGAARVRNKIIAECAQALQQAGLRDEALLYLRLGDSDQVTEVGSSRVDLQACKLEYSIVSPK